MIAKRSRLLGPAYSLFYDRPVQLVRGEGAWLYDETGRRYLDAYNNVAWRLAKARTGAGGSIVIEQAYHGSTEAVSWLTPSEWLPGTEIPQVQTLAAPDDYRGPFRRGEPDIGHRHAGLTSGAIERLRSAGFDLSSFFCDTAFSTHRILVAPDDYLKEVFALVRESASRTKFKRVSAAWEVLCGASKPTVSHRTS